ncbi:glutamate receptor ionotropic, kainate 2-like [Daphnia carinata]|uniref:glutamate receptor ionotropic, kainate 2-like n=1 Tax=Daphnia carinata TaxID=120202 RepID=UPI00257DB8E3|nr:glutamate receptor ionotropic, kainate 2-like [Daphnia carinata]
MAYSKQCLLLVLMVFTLATRTSFALPEVIRIGGLFDSSDPMPESAFRQALERINDNGRFLPKSNLVSMSERLPPSDSHFASRKVCQMLRNGLAAVLGPSSLSTSSHVQSICDALEIPHVNTGCQTRLRRTQYAINLHPHPTALGQAYVDVIRTWNWKTFTILYEEEDSMVRLQHLIKASTSGYKINVQKMPETTNFRPFLKEIHTKGERHIMLDCSAETLAIVLKQAQQVGLITSSYSFFITSLDLHTLDLEDYKYSGTNITGLRLVDLNKIKAANLTKAYSSTSRYYNPTLMNPNATTFTTETALTYDAVHMIAKALAELDRSQDVRVKSLNCDGIDTWIHGNSLINYMTLVEMEGLTGLIKFDTQGYRTFFYLSIMELTPDGLTTVSSWNPIDGANVTRPTVTDATVISDDHLINKTFIVSSKLSDPYFMLKESADMLTGNDRFEGFVVDVIDEVSKLLGFKYVLRLAADSNYGSLDPVTGEWNGIIRELLEEKADLGIADLSITYEREQAVDFSLPFMNTGISILYKKPQKQPPSLFSFLSPLSVEVWIYMCAAYVGISLALFILARLTPLEWVNPHPCDPNPKEYENQFNFLNSTWFTIGSLMQQGCDLAPRATSTRMVAGIWWFFTMIMISSYTANLAAFLTIERVESPISSVEDLAKQTKIKYGIVGSGSTLAFFRDAKIATYQRMWQFMEANNRSSTPLMPGPYVKSNMEGVKRVQDSKGLYAFLMESSTIEFFTERKCDLTQVGGMIDSKGYGIAMRPGSKYRASISQAVLKLQETNRLLILKSRWWKEKRGGGACKDEGGGSSAASELGLANVGGVFVVLIGGLGIAMLISLCEFAWEARNVINEEGGSFWKGMLREFRSAVRTRGNTKPVKRRYGSSVARSESKL